MLYCNLWLGWWLWSHNVCLLSATTPSWMTSGFWMIGNVYKKHDGKWSLHWLCQGNCSSALCIIFVGQIHLECYHFWMYEITPSFYIMLYMIDMSLFFHRLRPQEIYRPCLWCLQNISLKTSLKMQYKSRGFLPVRVFKKLVLSGCSK